MSIIKIVNTKNDGWHWTTEACPLTDPPGIYEDDAHIFEKALLAMKIDSTSYRIINDGNVAAIKARLWHHLQYELNTIADNLKHDLDHNVRIYPRITKNG